MSDIPLGYRRVEFGVCQDSDWPQIQDLLHRLRLQDPCWSLTSWRDFSQGPRWNVRLQGQEFEGCVEMIMEVVTQIDRRAKMEPTVVQAYRVNPDWTIRRLPNGKVHIDCGNAGVGIRTCEMKPETWRDIVRVLGDLSVPDELSPEQREMIGGNIEMLTTRLNYHRDEIAQIKGRLYDVEAQVVRMQGADKKTAKDLADLRAAAQAVVDVTMESRWAMPLPPKLIGDIMALRSLLNRENA